MLKTSAKSAPLIKEAAILTPEPTVAAKTAPHAELFQKVKTCIDERIRPFIQMDGGDIEVIELVDAPLGDNGKPTHKILRVQLNGACVGCMASSFTLQFGVQNAINEEFPDEDIMLEQIGQPE